MADTSRFDENSLRADIVKVWGEHGAHIDVFDHMDKLAQQNRLLSVVAWTEDGHTILTANDWRERGVDPEQEGFSPVYMRTVH